MTDAPVFHCEGQGHAVRAGQTVMRPLGAMGFLAIILSGSCVDLPATTANGPPPRPPPEIGSSITHTRLCSCRACERSGCCTASSEPEPAPPSDRCGSYDFSAEEGCGMSLESCASRCFERVWRVSSAEACLVKRPAECCI